MKMHILDSLFFLSLSLSFLSYINASLYLLSLFFVLRSITSTTYTRQTTDKHFKWFNGEQEKKEVIRNDLRNFIWFIKNKKDLHSISWFLPHDEWNLDEDLSDLMFPLARFSKLLSQLYFFLFNLPKKCSTNPRRFSINIQVPQTKYVRKIQS